MGYWGVKSYENDEAADALDAGFALVHGQVYEDMMDDGNPLTYEQVQAKLTNEATLAAALTSLNESVEAPLEEWPEEAKLGFVGLVVKHAELGVPIPKETAMQAIAWLEAEEIDWDEATARTLRKRKEIDMLMAQTHRI